MVLNNIYSCNKYNLYHFVFIIHNSSCRRDVCIMESGITCTTFGGGVVDGGGVEWNYDIVMWVRRYVCGRPSYCLSKFGSTPGDTEFHCGVCKTSGKR